MAEINDKKRYNPSILELKPNIKLAAGPPHGSSSYGASSHGSHSHGPPSHGSPSHHHQGYQPLKFRPTVEINDFKPSHQMSHSEAQSGAQFKPSEPTYKPGKVIALKPVVKKIKLVTPGLKHYATVRSRNDYSNYFRSRSAQEDQRDASTRMVQSMFKRNPRANWVPQYAPTYVNM